MPVLIVRDSSLRTAEHVQILCRLAEGTWSIPQVLSHFQCCFSPWRVSVITSHNLESPSVFEEHPWMFDCHSHVGKELWWFCRSSAQAFCSHPPCSLCRMTSTSGAETTVCTTSTRRQMQTPTMPAVASSSPTSAGCSCASTKTS